MDVIKDVIHDVIGNIAEKNPAKHKKIDRIWLNVLEEAERKHTNFQGIKEGNISVLVDSPAWLYEMRIKKFKILQRLQEELPDIKNIYFKIGKLK
jgi:predicted nucleic acid-binding Zn ribbon protein